MYVEQRIEHHSDHKKTILHADTCTRSKEITYGLDSLNLTPMEKSM